MTRTTVAILATALAASGCDRSSSGAGTAVHRDSAGIRITENSDAPDRESPWIVDPEPSVEIGVVEGDAPYQFFNVTDAARLSDGSIVVVNSGTSELRMFDAAGRFVRAIGGQGGGPGEFGYIERVVVLPGDTLVTVDMRAPKQTWFGPTGTLVREQRLDRGGWPIASGQVLVRSPVPAAEPPPGLYRRQEVFTLIDPESATVDTLGQFGMEDNFFVREGDHVRPWMPPFFRNTWWAIGSDRVFVGDSDRYQVLVYGFDGTLRQIIRLHRPAEPVTDADRAAYEKWRRESIAERRGSEGLARVNRYLSQLEWHSTKPSFGQLYTDTDDRVWAKHHAEMSFDVPYDVFDTSGVFLGSVTLPDGVEPLEIGPDYLIGRWRNEADVEFVRVYRMSPR